MCEISKLTSSERIFLTPEILAKKGNIGCHYTGQFKECVYAWRKTIASRMFRTAQIFTNGKGFNYFYPMVDNIALLLRTHTPV
jgi:hypothetical protein